MYFCVSCLSILAKIVANWHAKLCFISKKSLLAAVETRELTFSKCRTIRLCCASQGSSVGELCCHRWPGRWSQSLQRKLQRRREMGSDDFCECFSRSLVLGCFGRAPERSSYSVLEVRLERSGDHVSAKNFGRFSAKILVRFRPKLWPIFDTKKFISGFLL